MVEWISKEGDEETKTKKRKRKNKKQKKKKKKRRRIPRSLSNGFSNYEK